MEFRDALKLLRSELGITQAELANALHINFSTVGRWESGKTQPTRSMSSALAEYARSKGVSPSCMECLKHALAQVGRKRVNAGRGSLYTVEHASLAQLVEEASFPIYVCDMETDELLFLNGKAEELFGCGSEDLSGRKCYQCLMRRDKPCDFCHKNELVEDSFMCFEAPCLFGESACTVQGKRIRWNGRDAHVCYITQADRSNQLESIIENMNGGVTAILYDQDGGVRHAFRNKRYLEMFGYTAEQFAAELKVPYAIVVPEDVPQVRAMMEHIRATGQSATFRYRARTRDGDIRYVSCSSSLASIKGFGDKVVLSVMTDDTAAMKTEQQALVAGQRLNAIIDNINSGVVASIIRKDGTVDYVFVTDRYYELLGFTREQYHREVSDPFSLVYRDDLEKTRAIASSMRTVDETRSLQYRAVRRDGRVIWLDVQITMMSFADEDEPVQLSVFTDITHIAETTEQLAVQRDEINEMLNTTPSGIAVIEIDPRNPASLHTTYYNDRFFGFSGYTREEYDAILKQDEMGFVFEEDVPILMADTQQICAGAIGTAKDSTIRCHTKDGGYRWLLLTGQLADKRGDICVVKVSLVDITLRKEAEDKLRIREEMLRLAAETDKRALITYDVKANTCRVESRNLFSAKFGDTFENIPDSVIEMDIVAPDSVASLRALFERIRKGEAKIAVSLRLRVSKDDYQWFECNASTVLDADGRPDRAVMVFHNITEQRVKEAVFRKWQNSIKTRAPESYTLFRCNLSKNSNLDEQEGELLKIRFSSKRCSFDERTKEYMDAYVYPDDLEAYSALMNSDTLLAMFYRGEHAATLEYRETGEDGLPVWRLLTIEMVEYLNSTDVQAFMLYEDIDERKQAEFLEIERAESDPLTGVLNRMAFAEKADALLARESASQHALLMMDMDGFKQLNDTFGHAAGDQALMDAVAILRSLSRDGDLICRLGGDEFLVFLRGIPYDAVIKKIAKQLCEQVHKAFSQEVELSASVGVAVYPRDGRDFDALYHSADSALYRVKQAGKNNFAFFSESDATQPDTETEPAEEQTAFMASKGNAKRRMLIVDDDGASRAILANIFRKEYLIEVAKNGTEALLRLRHFGTAISVVLLDLIMPSADGYEVLRKMQANVDLRTIPAVVVSADDSRESLLKAIECGAADFVSKPVDPELIRLRVKSAISKMENERLRAQNSYLQLQRDEEMKYRTVLESTGTVVVEYDWRNHVFVYTSDIEKYIAGTYNRRSLWQVFLSDMVADCDDVRALQDGLMSLANDRTRKSFTSLTLLKTPTGQKHWFRNNIYKQVDDFGLAEKMIITFNDVHDEVLANEKLRYQATRDELTGLYNRAGFIEKAAEMIAVKPSGYFVMSCLDIEKFKVINDQFGTAKGDEVLRKIADVLEQLHRNESGISCRISADNFAVLYPVSLTDTPKLAALQRAIVQLDDTIPTVKFYVGRYVVEDKTLDVSAIYDRASMAKNTVKGRYDAYVATYDESMRATLLRQQEITGQMKSALENGQFEVWLQPQFNHATGMLSGAEALVRWRHPKDGIISPAEFIPVFEKNGFVYEMDKFVWGQTCRLLRKWLDRGLTPVPVSVNISRYDVFRNDVIDVITGLVKQYDLPTDLLRLEITESAFSESSQQIIRTVERLVALGFVVEIDDFGSGYSSLNTLKDVPAQVLKMDMRFLENDSNAQRGGSIIESVVRMARWLGMAVIAEGVETIEQADYLKSIGCEHIQGYLYSKPRQISEYERIFMEGKAEAQLTKLQTTETWNNNAFWNPKSIESLIFNSYVGGACIFEYRNGETELLRYNDSFVETFRPLGEQNFLTSRKDLLALLNDENAALVRSNIEATLQTRNESACEIEFSGANGDEHYVRTTIRQIAQAGDRYLFYCVVNDITAQREAERIEREAADRIGTIMGSINAGVAASVVRDGKVHYLFANERYYELLGYNRESYTARFSGSFFAIHEDDKEKVRAVIAQATACLKPYSVEFRVIRGDGSVRWMFSSINIVRLPDIAEPVHLATVSDTTELHLAQEKEQEAAERVRAIMENAPSGVTAIVMGAARAKERLLVNDKYYDLVGYTPEQYAAEVASVMELICPDDLEETREQLLSLNEVGQSKTLEFRIRRRDGRLVWVQDDIAIISLKGVDAPVRLSCFTDITSMREAQRQEHVLSVQLQTIMANIHGGITVTRLHDDGSVDVVFANDGFYEMYGYTKEQLEAEVPDILDVLLPEDREKTLETVRRIVTERACVTYEYRCRRRDGSIMWTQATNSVLSLEGDDDTLLLAVATDITALKDINTQLQYTNETAHDILEQPDCELAIRETLSKLLAYHEADRVYVVELDDGKMLSYNTYEVCAPGVDSEQASLQAVPYSRNDFWYDALSRNEFFSIENVDDLPDAEQALRQMLAAQGIRSLIIAPLWRDGRLIGFAGADNARAAMGRSQQLKAMGDYIAFLLTRRDLNRAIEHAAADMEQLLNDTPGGFCRLALRSGEPPKLIAINQGLCRLLDMTEAEVYAEYGADVFKAFVEEDISASLPDAREARRAGKQYTSKCRVRKKNGDILWVRAFGRFVKDRHGNDYLNIYFTDTTEQQNAEELRVKLMDNLTCGIILFELDGAHLSVIHINRNYWKMVHREPVDYSRAEATDFIHPEDYALVMQEMATCIRQRREFACDFRVANGEGGYTPFHVTATVEPEEDGRYLFYATYTPISQQTMSVQKMFSVAISTMMSSSDNIAYVKDKDLRYLSVSQAMAEMAGLSDSQEMVGKTADELFDARIAAQFNADDERIVTTGKPVIGKVESIPFADGSLHAVRTSKYPILDSTGAVVGVYSLSMDVTAQKEKESQLELLTSSIPGGLAAYVVLPDGIEILYFNDGYFADSGYTRDEYQEMARRDPLALVPEEDKPIIRAALSEITSNLRDGARGGCTFRCRTKKGEYRWKELQAVLTQAGTERYILNVVQLDITDQMEARSRQLELLDSLPCGAALYEYDGENLSVIHINKRYWELVGREPVEYGSASILDALYPDDKAAVQDEVASAVRQKRNAQVDARILCGNAEYRPFRIRANIGPEAAGKRLLAVSYIPLSDEDMSLHDMLPIVLSTVMSNSEELSFIKDSEGRYITYSKTAARYLGLPNERDIIGKTSREVFGGEIVEQFAREDRQILATGKPMLERMIRLPITGGRTAVFCTSKYPLLDGAGRVMGIYSICRDVTAEKETEFELDTLLRVIPSGVLKYSADDKAELAYVNRNFVEALGYTEEQFRAKFHNSFREVIWREDRERAQTEILAQETEGRIGRLDYRVEAADGQLHWFHDEGVRVADGSGKAWYYVTLVDITAQRKSEESLRQAEEEYRIATRHSGHTIGRYDIAARTLTITDDVATRLALPECIPDVPYGRVKLGKISEDTADAYIAFYEGIMKGKAEDTVTFRKLLSVGWRWITEHATTIFDEQGRPVSAIISYKDVTEQQEKEIAYKRWQQSIEERDPTTYTLFRCNLNNKATFDLWEGSLISVTLGSDLKTFNDRTAAFMEQCVYKEDRKRYSAFVNSDTMLAEYHRGHRADHLEFRQQMPDGGIRWLKLSVDLVEAPHSRDVEAYLLYESIDEQKKAELEVAHLAETDPLTGLLNRKAFAERVNDLLQSKPDAGHAFFMLDVDGFKLLNDTFGHAAGDEALIEIAHKLQALLRKEDLLGRLGGDEFVLFLSNLSSEKGVAKKAEQICRQLAKAYSAEIRLTASIGVALFPRDGADAHALYEKADTALYAAKGSGRDTFQIYSDALPEKRDGGDAHEMDAEVRGASPQTRKRRVLIVSDCETDQTLLTETFGKEYLVNVASDGMTALSRMRYYGSALSVALLDLGLSGMSGFEILEKARNSPEMRGVPIVAINGEDDSEACMRAIRSGAADYVVKPIQPELMQLRVAAAISRAENERLRAQNSYLQLRGEEISRYQTVLAGMGMFVVELDWEKGAFLYDATIANHLKGVYDDRTLWDIFRMDRVASATDAQRLQAFLNRLAEDSARSRGGMRMILETPAGEKRRFQLAAEKLLDAEGRTQKLILTFKDLARGLATR